jgi:hypothetical protein
VLLRISLGVLFIAILLWFRHNDNDDRAKRRAECAAYKVPANVCKEWIR